MKSILFGLVILVLTSTSFSQVVECLNESTHWEEDSLTLDLETMTGGYFDNDTDRLMVCKKSELIEEKSYIFCHEKGNEKNLITRIEPNGETIVIYSPNQWIDFQCDIGREQKNMCLTSCLNNTEPGLSASACMIDCEKRYGAL